jgi:hypothetical protein
MPELALGFSIGAGFSLVLSCIFYFIQIRRYNSKEFLIVQENLKLAELRWNDLEGRLEKWTAEGTEAEINKAKHTFFLFGCAAVVLSWLGLFFLLLMWFSIEKLIKNRIANYIFTSEISKKVLSAEQMRDFGLKLEGLGFDSLIFQAQANNQ